MLSTRTACVQCHVVPGGEDGTCEACQKLIEQRIQDAKVNRHYVPCGDKRNYDRPVQKILRAGATSSSDKRRGRVGYAM